MMEARSFIGLDVGGTELKAIAFAPDGTVLVEKKVPTNDDGTNSWLHRARELAFEILKKAPQPARLGVGAPGLPAADGKSIASMSGRLAGLEGLNWQEWLQLNFPVPVLNDAHAALLGEKWKGAARGSANAILLTLGTGVGGAAIVDNQILRGHLGRAGHLGHVSLDADGAPDIVNTPGSLEDAIGECTLLQRSGGRFKATRELIAAYREGNSDAAKIWLKSVRALAAALAGLINVLDPERIIIGGGISDAGDALFTPLVQELDRFEWRPGGARVRVVKAELGNNAGATGVAYAAKLASTGQTSIFASLPNG